MEHKSSIQGFPKLNLKIRHPVGRDTKAHAPTRHGVVFEGSRASGPASTTSLTATKGDIASWGVEWYKPRRRLAGGERRVTYRRFHSGSKDGVFNANHIGRTWRGCLEVRSGLASGSAEEDVVEEFFRDRQLHGDFITKYSDIIFQRGAMRTNATDIAMGTNNSQNIEETIFNVDEAEEGFLKLATTQEWLLGETSAPVNRKTGDKELQDDRERRRRLNILWYEALKRELLFMTIGVGATCTGYCLLTLSVQAAVSYASGVGFSCLYLQLLYQHADNITKDSIPQIFMQKKQKKIGIRSEDLKDTIEKSVKGSGIALSSPRLVIPAAIYGFWILLHRNFASDLFDFQIVPAMMGLFAYKAAALVQVYRDNEDLKFIFQDDHENSDG